MPKSKTNGKTPDISMDEWLEEMERLGATGSDDEGLSRREIQKLNGYAPDKVKRYLHQLKDEGRLIVGWRSDTRIDGLPCKIPVYSLTPKK